MSQDQDRIDELLKRLENLSAKQHGFFTEINNLRREVNELRAGQFTSSPQEPAPVQEVPEKEVSEKTTYIPGTLEEPAAPLAAAVPGTPPRLKTDLEKFIGENLINKIGIAITVLGVAIGAKYSIENELISPATRIILGYLAGLGLLGIGLKLKKNYANYSAVLVGGAISILYFITYAAYNFYSLFSQSVSFALMVILTGFAVMAAMKYNKQVIAHFGLVGAYAVPFLLSEGSGNPAILFSYMGIINVGILVISFRKYWKPLFYSSFGFTWLIYVAWFFSHYQNSTYFSLAFFFLGLFFTLFYAAFLAYKLLQKERFNIDDVFLVLANSFIFYGIGYIILMASQWGEEYAGLFTLGNAGIHLVVSAVIYNRKLSDINLFHLIFGLVLVFLTITIPVQLDGNWVTLLWVGEAALLFWIGRTRKAAIYEKLSYPLMLLAVISLLEDWSSAYPAFVEYSSAAQRTPFLNIHFLSSLLFVGAFAFINYIHAGRSSSAAYTEIKKLVNFFIPAVLLVSLYFAIRLEISAYWDQKFIASTQAINPENMGPDDYRNYDLPAFKAIWILNYTLIFLSLLSFINMNKLREKNLGAINLVLNVMAITVFLIQGLLVLSELRETYLEQEFSVFERGPVNIAVRYISFVFVGLALFATYRYAREKYIDWNFQKAVNIFVHISLLWILSSELIHWMDIFESTQSYKLGLSILWGVYSLFLITLGIWKRKKHLRVAAMVLFGITLIKLFLYDISHLDTISRTIVFVSLGLLLLIISFLYNKYKASITIESDG